MDTNTLPLINIRELVGIARDYLMSMPIHGDYDKIIQQRQQQVNILLKDGMHAKSVKDLPDWAQTILTLDRVRHEHQFIEQRCMVCGCGEPLNDHGMPYKVAVPTHGSCMVAFFCPATVGQKIAVPGGYDPTDLHVTLAYLGKTDNLNKASILETVERWAKKQHNLYVDFDGVEQFGNGTAMVMRTYTPALMDLRADLVQTLLDAGIQVDMKWPEFKPHVTLYDIDPENPELLPVTVTSASTVFSNVWVAYGDERYSYTFDNENRTALKMSILRDLKADIVRGLSYELTRVQESTIKREWHWNPAQPRGAGGKYIPSATFTPHTPLNMGSRPQVMFNVRQALEHIRSSPTVQHIVSEMGSGRVQYLHSVELANKDEIHGDHILASIAHEKGFDGLPQYVNPGQMNQLIEEGHTELARGVSDWSHATAYQTGKYFAGLGIMGNGTYTAIIDHGTSELIRRGIATAYGYASPLGEVMRLAITPQARTVDVDHLDHMRMKINAYIDEHETNPDESNARSALRDIIVDDGRLAALLGYDAITETFQAKMDANAIMVVLNRTATAVQDRKYNALAKLDRLVEQYEQDAAVPPAQRVQQAEVQRQWHWNPAQPRGAGGKYIPSEHFTPHTVSPKREGEYPTARVDVHQALEHIKSSSTVEYLMAVMGQGDHHNIYQVQLSNRQEVHGDHILASIATEKGFDGLPQYVTPAQMNHLIQQGDQELVRGVSEKAHATAYQTGKYYGGIGILGNGTYTAVIDQRKDGVLDGFHVARGYASPHGQIMRIALSNSARIINTDHIQDIYKQLVIELHYKRQTTPQESRETRALLDIISDDGRLAMLLGYDALIDDHSFTTFNGGSNTMNSIIVVLNRTATAVQDKTYGYNTNIDKIINQYNKDAQVASENRVRAIETPNLVRNYEYTDSHGNTHEVIQGTGGKWINNLIIAYGWGKIVQPTRPPQIQHEHVVPVAKIQVNGAIMHNGTDLMGLARQSMDHLGAYLNKEYPHMYVNLRGVEPHNGAILVSELLDLGEKYPEAMQVLHAVRVDYGGVLDPKAYAGVTIEAQPHLLLSPGIWSSATELSSKLQKDAKSGWLVGAHNGDNIRATVTHEFGHVMERWMHGTAHSFVPAVRPSGFGIANDLLSRWQRHFGTVEVSRYALLNQDETFAEMFTALRYGDPLIRDNMMALKSFGKMITVIAHGPRYPLTWFRDSTATPAEKEDLYKSYEHLLNEMYLLTEDI